MDKRSIADETTEFAAGETPAEALETAEAAPEADAFDAAPENTESAAAAPSEAALQSAESAPEAEAAKKAKVKNAVMIGVIVALIVVLLPLLIINLTLIIKGSLNPDMPPDLFGTAPLAVTTDAMVTFRSEELFVTYRITEVVRGEDGSVHSFRVIGDQDAKEGVNVPLTVSPENVIGVVTGSVAGLGGFAMFLQTPVGVLVFVGIPVVAYLIYDISRIALSNKRAKAAQGEKLREKDEEIARLKAMVGEAPDAAEDPEEE